MGIDFEYLENEDNLNEFERENHSMNDAYNLLLGSINNWELEFKADDKNSHLKTAHKSIDTLISYFENREEYEKCNELNNYRNLRDLDIFLEGLS